MSQPSMLSRISSYSWPFSRHSPGVKWQKGGEIDLTALQSGLHLLEGTVDLTAFHGGYRSFFLNSVAQTIWMLQWFS